MEKEKFKSDWAYSDKLQKEIHISKAESGLKGYRCLGCYSQMQAVIQKKDPSRLSFFRHHASNIIKDKPECIRANKEYREKIARSILNRLKYVNAPAIYKKPPTHEVDFMPMKIEGKKKITASYTRAELTFYEDNNGVIKWGKNPELTDKNLLIRPDVTFFSADNKPILFIEFIVNHKIKQDKYLKLSRLGIDTLQIIIPRKSEEEIEKVLKSSKTYKWVYNEKEANTEYISVSRRNSEELPQINENERIFFEEDFRCRQAEINQLIRSIRKSLSSEHYSRIEFEFNKQIQKEQEKNWEIWKNQIEKKHLEEIQEKKKKKIETIKIWKKDILQKEETLKTLSKELEFQKKLERNLLEISKKREEKSQELKKIYEPPLIQKSEKLNGILDLLKLKKEKLRAKYSKSLKNKSSLKTKKLKDLQLKKRTLRLQLEEDYLKTLIPIPKDCPNELKIYWQQEEWGAISKLLVAKRNAIKELTSFLKRELGHKGKTIEWFMKTYEDEIKKLI